MTLRHLLRVTALMLLVAALDPRAGALGQGAGGGRATLVVINQEDSTIGFHDAGSGERIGLARTGMRPHEAVLSADGQTAYVALYGDGIYGDNPRPNNQIAVISLKTMREDDRIDLGPFRAPHGMQIDARGMLWVTVEDNEGLIVVDPRERRVVAHVPTGGRNHWLALAADGAKAYTSNKQTPWIGVVDTATRRLTKRILMPRGVQNIAASPDGRRLYAMDFSVGAVHVIDTARDDVVAMVTLGNKLARGVSPGPGRLSVTPDGRTLLVTVNAARTLEIIDAETLAVRRVVDVEASPMGVAVAPDSRTAFVANTGAGTVSVVDLVEGRITRTLPVGQGPEFILYGLVR